MTNIDITALKKVTEPKLVEIIKVTFVPEIIVSIANGLGYSPTITEQIMVEKESEGTDGEKIKFMSYETVEKENPQKPICYVADKFMDILFEKSMNAIDKDIKDRAEKQKIQMVTELLKPFEEVAKTIEAK